MEWATEILSGIDTDTRDWEKGTLKKKKSKEHLFYECSPTSGLRPESVTAAPKYCSNTTVASKEYEHIFMNMHKAEKVLYDQRQLDNANAN